MEQKELLTVIVADDETELREAVCSVIPWKEIGFRLVGSAGNGLDALQLVEQLQPGSAADGHPLPYISGVSLAQQVRELRPLTQIAFLSGYDDFAYAQKAIEYNVISYLLKPISMRELTEALAEIRGKIRRKFARLLPQKPEKSGWARAFAAAAARRLCRGGAAGRSRAAGLSGRRGHSGCRAGAVFSDGPCHPAGAGRPRTARRRTWPIPWTCCLVGFAAAGACIPADVC